MKKSYLLLLCVLFSFSGIQAQLNLPNDFNASKLVGHWEFKSEADLLKATVGSNLTPVISELNYWEEVDGVPTIRMDGTPSKEEQYKGGGLLAPVDGLFPYNGSDGVYKFCIVYDVKVDADRGLLADGTTGINLTSLYHNETRSDGCAFIGFSNSAANRLNGIGQTNYRLNTIKADKWQRIIINTDLSDVDNPIQNLYVVHATGEIFLYSGHSKGQANNSLFHGKNIVFWGDAKDGDYEYGRVNVSQIALFNDFLDASELADLGVGGFTVDKESLDFGYVQVETVAGGSIDIEVNAFEGVTGDIEFILDNKTDFLIDPEQAPIEDGKVNATLFFFPEEVGKEYSASLTIKSASKELTLPITGIGAPRVPIETGVWYRIQFDKRTKFLLAGKTPEEPAGINTYDTADDSQLWKFEATSDPDAFTMVNKAGNGLEYRYEDEAAEIPGRFLIASGTNNNTYTFDVRSDGCWQIKWNEYESENSEGIAINGSYINKTASGNEFTAYGVNPDPGSSVVFLKENETIDIGLPEFSTANDPVWYFIQFYRTANDYGFTDRRFQSAGLENDILQTDFDAETKESFYWRFEGTWDNFKIFDYDDNAFGATTSSISKLALEDDASAFKFVQYSTTSDWQIQDLNSSYYLNDNGRSKVGGWSSDGGCRLLIFKVDDLSSIEDAAVEEEILSSVYYTIQGVQLNAIPVKQGLYIKKDIYVSGKSGAKTIFIQE